MRLPRTIALLLLVALSASGMGAARVHRTQYTAMQPSASLSTDEMLAQLAMVTVDHMQARRVLSRHAIFPHRVSDTGSMRPSIGDGDVVLGEYADYDQLSLGDIPSSVDGVLHRIVGGKPGAWVMRGDNNRYRDPELLTRERYDGWRVCAVFYTRKPLN